MSTDIDNAPLMDNAEANDSTEVLEPVLTDDQLSNMSDIEFEEFLNSGKLPDSLQQTDEVINEDNVNSNSEEVEDNTNTNEEPNETESEVITEKTVTESESTIDYEKAYKELFDTPIKADGTEIKINNKDELIALVQKGVNYTRKSQELSKKKKIIQSLEEANIKTEEDLNLIIDIYKGNPKAIKSFIDKRNIELDTYTDDNEEKYIPNNNIVSDNEVRLNDVITEINRSPHKDKISNILNNVWDKESVKLISEDPALLEGLYGEIVQGRFDSIHSTVVKEKLFSTDNVPDIIRYMKHAKELEDNKTNSIVQSDNIETVVKPKAVAGNKKSASIQKNVTKTIKRELTNKDLDTMSDEDLLKLKF